MSNTKKLINAIDKNLNSGRISLVKSTCDAIQAVLQHEFNKDPLFKEKLLKDQPESITKLFT